VSAAGGGAATAYAAAEDQIAYWNGSGGQRWLALQRKHDLLFAPLTAALFARACIMPGERVLDIGCGCGATTIEAARRAGEAGNAVGVDVSEQSSLRLGGARRATLGSSSCSPTRPRASFRRDRSTR
jgi:SAM-dependent methyltransferase